MANIINKIKSTVSEVIPGNPLSSEYEIRVTEVTAFGPCSCWKGFSAVRKSTKQEETVFVFSKKSIDKCSRDERKHIVTILKQGIQQLTRLRHPRILSVTHTVEENRDCLAFATEQVETSLQSLLDKQTSSSNQSGQTDKSTLSEVEIKQGLLHILEALWFIHHDVKAVHGNITPNSIMLNSKRMWKLAGFEFFIQTTTDNMGGPSVMWTPGKPDILQPPLDYISPEMLINAKASSKSDIYSLAVTVHSLFNKGSPVYQSHNSLAAAKRHIMELTSQHSSISRSIPEGLKSNYLLMLSTQPESRPDAKSLPKIGYFDDVSVLTLVYLDSLVQRDNLEKSQYFKNLPNILRTLPQSLCIYRILPALFKECTVTEMIPFVLQNILIIAEKSNKHEYFEQILPNLIPIMKYQQPIQIPLQFLQNMPMLLEKTDEYHTKQNILPMLYSSLHPQSSTQQLQELALDLLPNFSKLLDKNSMENSVVTLIKNLAITTQNTQVKNNCLVCMGKMLPHMDKWFVVDQILTFVCGMRVKDATILMSILGVYQLAFSHANLGISKERIATQCLPFLIPTSIETCLSSQQYEKYAQLIKQMMEQVEKEHRGKLKNNERDAKEQTFGITKSKGDKEPQSMVEFLKRSTNDSPSPPSTRSMSPAFTDVSKSATSSTAASPARQISNSSQKTENAQVKDLTATLGSMAFTQSPINPISQPSAQTTNNTLPDVRPSAQILPTLQPQVAFKQPITSQPGGNTQIDWSKASKPSNPALSNDWSFNSANITSQVNSLGDGRSLKANSSHLPKMSNNEWSFSTAASTPSNFSSTSGINWGNTGLQSTVQPNPPMSNPMQSTRGKPKYNLSTDELKDWLG